MSELRIENRNERDLLLSSSNSNSINDSVIINCIKFYLTRQSSIVINPFVLPVFQRRYFGPLAPPYHCVTRTRSTCNNEDMRQNMFCKSLWPSDNETLLDFCETTVKKQRCVECRSLE